LQSTTIIQIVRAENIAVGGRPQRGAGSAACVLPATGCAAPSRQAEMSTPRAGFLLVDISNKYKKQLNKLKDKVGMAEPKSTRTRFVGIITSTIHPYIIQLFFILVTVLFLLPSGQSRQFMSFSNTIWQCRMVYPFSSQLP
jgi:hypothetical protein